MTPGRAARERLDRILAGTDTASPVASTLRMPRPHRWEPGHVEGRWTVDPDFFHSGGGVFGGYLSAISDSYCSLAMLSTLGDDEIFTTADLRVSFFRPVTGGTLAIDARVLHRGRRLAHVEATFTDDEGKVAVKATATKIVTPLRDPEPGGSGD